MIAAYPFLISVLLLKVALITYLWTVLEFTNCKIILIFSITLKSFPFNTDGHEVCWVTGEEALKLATNFNLIFYVRYVLVHSECVKDVYL